uniref:HTH CENPB-type domain-containing protein n=1 Tax=Peronospora matthiolae TaxID=2874970 RepID=A0AAV1UZI6_9STRA
MGRQPLKKGGGRKERKNVRTSTTFETRLATIKHFEEGGDMTSTVEHFFPALSVQAQRSKKRVIYSWVKDRDKIAKACESANSAKAHRLRKPGLGLTLSSDAEKCIVVWLRSLQKLGVPVTGAMVSEHALEVAKELGIDSTLFTASTPWRKKFLERHGLSLNG